MASVRVVCCECLDHPLHSEAGRVQAQFFRTSAYWEGEKQGEVRPLMPDVYDRMPKASGNACGRAENPAQQLDVGGLVAHHLSMQQRLRGVIPTPLSIKVRQR